MYSFMCILVLVYTWLMDHLNETGHSGSWDESKVGSCVCRHGLIPDKRDHGWSQHQKQGWTSISEQSNLPFDPAHTSATLVARPNLTFSLSQLLWWPLSQIFSRRVHELPQSLATQQGINLCNNTGGTPRPIIINRGQVTVCSFSTGEQSTYLQ